MKKQEMNVFYASSKAYLKYLYVSLYSLFISNIDYKINVYIASFDAGQEDLRDIIDLASEFENSIKLLVASEEVFRNGIQKYRREVLYKVWERAGKNGILYFMIFDLLPLNIDRILYLHADTIIKSSLAEVYFRNIDGVYALTLDISYCNLNDELKMGLQRCLEKANCKKYCCEIFDVFNLNEIRRNNINFDYLMSIADIEPQDDTKSLINAWNYILTKAFADKVKYCNGLEYNYYSMEERTRTFSEEERNSWRRRSRIIHYDYYKPWDGSSLTLELDSFWWEYAKMTPYYKEFRQSFKREKRIALQKKYTLVGTAKLVVGRLKKEARKAKDFLVTKER